jgi:peptidoglycan/xylan/chitin deacetylase (PgdA/CDA1 family)
MLIHIIAVKGSLIPSIKTRVRPMLTWPEVEAMSRYGIEFMSHTVSHRQIGELADDEVLFEIAQSKLDIESHLKRPVPFVAWPFDNFSSRAICHR